MKRSGRKKEWSIVLFVLAALIFMPPFLSLYDRPVLVLGLPLSYLSLFVLWALVIALSAWGSRQSSDEDKP